MKVNLTYSKDGRSFKLKLKPKKKMKDSKYDKLKPIIENAGGHWRESEKAFIFYGKIDEHYDELQEMQYYPTPIPVVEEMITLSKLTKDSVILEPSAGDGRIVQAVNKQRLKNKVYAVETSKTLAHNLVDLTDKVYNGKFETFYAMNRFNKAKLGITNVIMNPPFSRQRDAVHIQMAFDLLQPGGRLVAIASENSLYYDTEVTREFKKFLRKNNAVIKPLEDNTFKHSKTTIDTVMIIIDKK